jgi:glycosyltransferase involved in cell wall biosynthesis
VAIVFESKNVEVKYLNVNSEPSITIGMPIWNSEDTVAMSIQSILAQDFTNWTLIISDNCSSDSTFEIAQGFASVDSRISVTRQTRNIGGWQNFKFVLGLAEGDYFKFHAGDDVVSSDYLRECINLLERESMLVGACAPDRWDWETSVSQGINDFSFEGNLVNRITMLRRKCWRANGVFYGIFRRQEFEEALNGKMFESKLHILDWLILARLLKVGSIARTSKGLMILGSNGASNSDPKQWYKQLDGIRSKVFPYKSFYRLFIEGSHQVSVKTKFELRKWILALYVNHYKGLLRLLFTFIYRVTK